MAKQISMIVAADSIVLATELTFNRLRAGAFGDKYPKPTYPMHVPANKGLIEPQTVPQEIHDIIQLINEPERMQKTGAHMWRGILLSGKSGIGKTELGYYIARQTGAQVLFKAASELMGPAQGSGAASVRQLFDTAYTQSIWTSIKKSLAQCIRFLLRRPTPKLKPIIMILDEIDAVGTDRSNEIGAARKGERIRTLEQLLTEIEGAHEYTLLPKIFVVGTTNHALNNLDEALIRSGRLHPIIIPDLRTEDREAILVSKAKKYSVSTDANFQQIAKETEGYTGADLCKLFVIAGQSAALANTSITDKQLLAAKQSIDQEKLLKAQKK